ncbi:hypothetical protein LUQ84_000764 [Hamiltosporidium tvaerminnensis]|nr:hypothetical protein LUQ84_000764 [Hamiltosporidium tvaerminnensis]
MNFKILVDEFFKIWSFEKCFYDSFIEVEDLKNDDQEDVLCDVIEKIYTLNIDGNEYSSFGWKIKNDHDFIQQLHIIFRICKIHKVNIFDYTILHEPIADILSRIAESIEKIDFFYHVIPSTIIRFINDDTLFMNLKLVVIHIQENDIEKYYFEPNGKFSVEYEKSVDNNSFYRGIPLFNDCFSIFSFILTLKNNYYEKIKFIQSLIECFRTNILWKRSSLDFLSDITLFGFYVRNKILSDQMEEIFLLENLKIIFSISYFGLNHMGYFEYPISVAEQIHYVSIHDSQIDYCCLQTILKFSCLKSLSISRTFIATLPKTRPFFKNTKLHSVSFVDVRYDDYKKFLNLLNYFKDADYFKFNSRRHLLDVPIYKLKTTISLF